MAHYCIKCDTCSKVISQCRCMSKDKIITFKTCDSCLLKNVKKENKDV